MKVIFICFTILFFACTNKQTEYQNAENALDAGREYIQSCLQGDFSKAKFYLFPNEKNIRMLKEIEEVYRQKDKEGRQQLRLASININEVKENGQTTSSIMYSNSFDKIPHTIYVLKQNNRWLVDISNAFNKEK